MDELRKTFDALIEARKNFTTERFELAVIDICREQPELKSIIIDMGFLIDKGR